MRSNRRQKTENRKRRAVGREAVRLPKPMTDLVRLVLVSKALRHPDERCVRVREFEGVVWFWDAGSRFKWFEEEYLKLIECKNMN